METFGRYQLIQHLASGGMADVYRAQVPGAAGFVKEVAIKVIRPGFSDRSDFIQMFIREAHLASKLNHANIVQVFDFDQVDGQYYIAMEYVHGRTLLELMDACYELGIPIGLPRMVQICAKVASALSYAHRLTDGGKPLGLVHRDVSPQNVLISFEGEVKLADFGIAHAMGAGGLTAPGIIKGKLAYMAPEQARAERVDGRADVFAVGTMLWELCTGAQPFARDSDAATLAAVLGPEPAIAPPSSRNALVPPELDEAIMRALERDRDKRTSSAQELATELSDISLRLTRSSGEYDLRPFMHQLWPEEAMSRPEVSTFSEERFPDDPETDESGPPVLDADADGFGPRTSLLDAPVSAPDTPPAWEAVPRVPQSGVGEVIQRTAVFKGATPAPSPARSGTSRAGSRSDVVPPRRGHALRVIIPVVGTVLVAGVGAVLFLRTGSPPSEIPTAVAHQPEEKLNPVQGGPTLPAPGSPGPGDPAVLPPPPDTTPSGPRPALQDSAPAVTPQPDPGLRRGDKRPTQPKNPAPARGPPKVKPGETAVRPSETRAGPGGGSALDSSLLVVSDQWAIIFVDGKRIGFTPVDMPISSGRHQLRAERTGSPPTEKTIVVRPGEQGRWTPVFKPAPR